MRFQLYLNQLSASQVLSETSGGESLLNCYGNCNPYNSRPPGDNTKPISSLLDIYEAIKTWCVRKEPFGYIMYDPQSSRLYEADAEASQNISCLRSASSFEEFLRIAEASAGCRSVLEALKGVCI